MTFNSHQSIDLPAIGMSHVCTIIARCDLFDQPTRPATPTALSAPSWAHGSTTPTPCFMVSNRRISIVFNASEMRWLDASMSAKFIGVLHQLHWLSIHHRINSKLTKLAFLARSSVTNSYLNSSVGCRPISAFPCAPLLRYLPTRCSLNKESLRSARASHRCANHL